MENIFLQKIMIISCCNISKEVGKAIFSPTKFFWHELQLVYQFIKRQNFALASNKFINTPTGICMTTLAYLACPYSHEDPSIMQRRYELATYMCYYLMQQGQLSYSPLTHNVPLIKLGMSNGWQNWQKFDHLMVEKCDRLIVLKIPGWESSKGVAAEMACAQKLGKPIEWLEPPAEVLKRGILYHL